MTGDTSAANLSGFRLRDGAAPEPDGGLHRYRWLAPIAGLILCAAALIYYFWGDLTRWDMEGGRVAHAVVAGFGLLLAAFLSALPLIICYVQNVSKRRQLAKLDNLQYLPVAKTLFFLTARTSIDTTRLVVGADYAPPMTLNFVLTFGGFIVIFLGYMDERFFAMPAVLLGGLNPPGEDVLAHFQRDTFCVMAAAFIGSYVYALGRILDRINNNDLYPISIHYYTARTIIACAVAAVFRHSISVFGFETGQTSGGIGFDAQYLLLLAGFVIGFTPDLLILVLSRKFFQIIKIWGTRADPEGTDLPRSLPLLMIDDLTREKIDRLNELGIDNAEVLARQNPLLLFTRLPFEPTLIIDWVAQAQLYVWVRDDKIMALRAILIRNMLDLYVRLSDEAARKTVCDALGLSEAEAPALLRQLDEDPSFLRMRELQAALKPSAI